jgi:glycosyltransferase involved in cell wall biosynthesis
MRLSPSSPIGSVVIPAYNEAAVVQRCLDSLLAGFTPGELDVVVACNGCTDDTADIVRSTWPNVHVIEIAEASKAAALRAADEMLSTFPRIYLDADVILPTTSARRVIESLRFDVNVAVRPRYIYDTSRSSVLVRSYFRALSRVQATTNSLWGGVYALSQAGRGRFTAYPDLVADDMFANQHFDPSEIKILDDAPATITTPRHIYDLFHVAQRRHKGNADIRSRPDGPPSSTSSTVHNLLSTAPTGLQAAIDTLFFFAFAIAVRASIAISPPTGWSRDESSRTAKVE